MECFLHTVAWWSCSRPKLIPPMAFTFETSWEVLTVSLTAGIFQTLIDVCEERRGDTLGSEHHKRTDQEELERKSSDLCLLDSVGEKKHPLV